MALEVNKNSKTADQAAQVVSAPAEPAYIDVCLNAHDRYMYQGNLYEKKNVYTVPEPYGLHLLRLRTDNGSMVFIRAVDLPEPVVVAPSAPAAKPKMEIKVPVSIGGLSAAQTAAAFNVEGVKVKELATPEEADDFEKQLARRAELELAAENAAAASAAGVADSDDNGPTISGNAVEV